MKIIWSKKRRMFEEWEKGKLKSTGEVSFCRLPEEDFAFWPLNLIFKLKVSFTVHQHRMLPLLIPVFVCSGQNHFRTVFNSLFQKSQS